MTNWTTMRAGHSWLRGLVVIGVAAVVGLAVTVVRAEIIEEILVKVNGEIFTKTDLETQQVQILRQRGQPIDLKSDSNNSQLRKALDEITPQIIVEAVDEILVVQRGKELGYKLSDDQFKTVVDGIKKDNHIETDDQWQAALKQENLTAAELRRNLERRTILERVRQNEVFGKISTSEDEARRYYAAHMNEFTTPATVSFREILVAVPSDGKVLNVGLDEERKAVAEEIRARALKGESFEKLAADRSDAPSRPNAGLIGPVSLTELSADLRRVVEPLKIGEVSAVLRTPRGYQIFKLQSSTMTQTKSFEQARDEISERVAAEKRKQEFDKYLAKLRSEAIIQWMNPDVERAYKEGVAQLTKAPPAS